MKIIWWFLWYRVQKTVFCHFGSFFVLLSSWQPEASKFWKHLKKKTNAWRQIIILHLCTTNDNHMMYGSWDINWIFGHFVLFFALLPSNKMKNQNFEKLKKTPGDIIILHMSTINENYMMCGSWDMECDRQIFFSFWTIFWLFYTPIITQRIKILKNWKKTPGSIIILHNCTKNHDHMLYCSWDTACYGRTC